jgi:hypothetical protein
MQHEAVIIDTVCAILAESVSRVKDFTDEIRLRRLTLFIGTGNSPCAEEFLSAG